MLSCNFSKLDAAQLPAWKSVYKTVFLMKKFAWYTPKATLKAEKSYCHQIGLSFQKDKVHIGLQEHPSDYGLHKDYSVYLTGKCVIESVSLVDEEKYQVQLKVSNIVKTSENKDKFYTLARHEEKTSIENLKELDLVLNGNNTLQCSSADFSMQQVEPFIKFHWDLQQALAFASYIKQKEEVRLSKLAAKNVGQSSHVQVEPLRTAHVEQQENVLRQAIICNNSRELRQRHHREEADNYNAILEAEEKNETPSTSTGVSSNASVIVTSAAANTSPCAVSWNQSFNRSWCTFEFMNEKTFVLSNTSHALIMASPSVKRGQVQTFRFLQHIKNSVFQIRVTAKEAEQFLTLGYYTITLQYKHGYKYVAYHKKFGMAGEIVTMKVDLKDSNSIECNIEGDSKKCVIQVPVEFTELFVSIKVDSKGAAMSLM